MTTAAMRREIERPDPWFHELELEGMPTALLGFDHDARYLAEVPLTEEARGVERGFPAMCSVEHRHAGDHASWRIPDEGATAAMLRPAVLRIEQHPLPGIHICRPERRTADRRTDDGAVHAGGAA